MPSPPLPLHWHADHTSEEVQCPIKPFNVRPLVLTPTCGIRNSCAQETTAATFGQVRLLTAVVVGEVNMPVIRPQKNGLHVRHVVVRPVRKRACTCEPTSCCIVMLMLVGAAGIAAGIMMIITSTKQGYMGHRGAVHRAERVAC